MHNIPDFLQNLLPRLLTLKSLQRRQRPQKVTGTLVATRVPVQVHLMILLSGPPLARGRNLRHNPIMPPLLIRLLRHLLCDLLLLLVVVVDGGAVLGAGVGALTVEGGGVVGTVEEFDELAVGDL